MKKTIIYNENKSIIRIINNSYMKKTIIYNENKWNIIFIPSIDSIQFKIIHFFLSIY